MLRSRFAKIPLSFTAIVIVAQFGCYEYRSHAPNFPGVTDDGEVVWSFFWGLAKEDPTIDCNGQPLAEVTVRDNLAFSILTVVTVGLVSPKKVEWKCARARPGEGIIRRDTTGVR